MKRDEAAAILKAEGMGDGALRRRRTHLTEASWHIIAEAALAGLGAAGASEECRYNPRMDKRGDGVCPHGAEHRAYALLRAAVELMGRPPVSAISGRNYE